MISLTLIIIGITAVVSFSAFNNDAMFQRLMFNAYVIKIRNEWHRVITHAFVHANYGHLLVNMFVLYFFGRNMEFILIASYGFMGKLYFLLLYFGGILFATLPSFKKHVNNPNYNAVGASGAVSAVLFAHILIMPTETLYLYFAIPLPSFLFGIGYLWYSAWMDKRSNDNVAHDAHFWGALFGIAFMVLLNVQYLFNFFTQIYAWFNSFL
jgi:membrane associated rhomboid family serine protease